MTKQAMSANFYNLQVIYVKGKIIVSGLLPRRDWDTREVEDINFNIARKILDLPSAHFVPHRNLFLTNTKEILNAKST